MAKEFVMGARIKLSDMFSNPLQKMTDVTEKFSRTVSRADTSIGRMSNGMTIADRATGLLRQGFDKVSNSALHAGHNMDGMKNSMHGAHGGMLAMYKSTAQMAVVMGTFAVAASPFILAFQSAKKAMDFEQEMSTIKALTGLAGTEMTQMSNLALLMGAKTKYSALEAAQGLEELLKAGLSPAQVQAGGLEASLNLATAGSLELADAATIMSTALNAFKSDAMKPAQAADILAGTANASATGVQELALSLSQVSAVAAGVGMSFMDTNVGLGLFANNGLKGSDAGTSLKTMLMNLQPQTDKQAKLMQQLGLVTANGANTFFTAGGKLKSLAEIGDVMQKSFSGMTDQQRLFYMDVIFGSDAIRAANILFKEGAKGVNEFSTAMSNVTALQVATEKMDNAAGAVEQLRGAFETMQIATLMPTMPIIKRLALSMADLATKYTPAITSAMQRGIDRAQSYVKTHFIDNPDFQNLSVSAKVGFIFDDLMQTFQGWLAGGGQSTLNGIGTTLIDIMATSVEAATPRIVSAALTVGGSMGKAILEGATNQLKNSWLGTILVGAAGGMAMGSVIPGVGNIAGGFIGAGSAAIVRGLNVLAGEMQKQPNGSIGDYGANLSRGPRIDGSHANGLSYVPFDGYRAELHRGERVLTANENRSRSGTNGKSSTLTKLADKIEIKIMGADQKDSKTMAGEILDNLYTMLRDADNILGSVDKSVLL